MPTYKYQAMDNLGKEVKDQVDAASEEDAQQKIKNMGYFVTQLTEVASKKTKGKRKPKANERASPSASAACR